MVMLDSLDPADPADGLVVLKHRVSQWVEAAATREDWVPAVWPDLCRTLATLRQALAPDAWAAARAWLQGSEIAAAALEDPFTCHSWDRPHGVVADGVLLDHVYGHPAVAAALRAATPVGRAVHAEMMRRPLFTALRERRGRLAGAVRQAAARRGAAVLTLAAGHLREAALLEDSELPARWVAADEDNRALTEIRRNPRPGIEPVRGSLERLATRGKASPEFDLVTCAGPLDGLGEAASTQLAAAAFGAVRPGGRLLLVVPGPGAAADAGYLEALMDWPLAIRDETALRRSLSGMPAEEVAASAIEAGEGAALLYATVTKAG
jgi:hypothetical protein